MMCNTVCRLCPRVVYSVAVTFADGTLTINIPEGSYNSGEVYCIVVIQNIPTTATRYAPVVVTIGDGTEEYPLTNRCGVQVTQEAINTRTRYKTIVSTTAAGGSFRIVNRNIVVPENALTAIDGTAPAEGGAGA